MKNFYKIIIFLIIPFYIFADDIKSITIFGDKMTEESAKNQANIIIITSEDIKRLNPKDTYDLLEKIPGINIKSYDSKNVTVNMGGFVGDKAGLNNVIILNGRRLNNADMSGVDLTLIPIDIIDRVEVYLGGNSVLFGDRATGGVINITTKKPIKNSLTLKASGGSYGLYDTYAEAVIASDKYSFLISGNKFGTQGYRDNSELYTGTINSEFTYYLDKLEITLNGLYTDSEYGFPSYLTLNDIATKGREHTNTPNDGGHDYEWLSGLKIAFDSDLGKLILDSQYKDRKRNYDLWGKNKDRLKTVLNSIKYELKFDKSNYKNKLIAGLEIENYDLDKKSSFSTDILERGIISYFISDRADIYSLYTELGVRVSKLEDDYISKKLSKDMNATAYNIAIGYNISKNQSIYIRYDKSFRYPTTDEINEWGGLNTKITKQDTKTYEIGYKANLQKYFASISAYKQISDNEIFTDPDWNWVGPANINFDTRKYVVNLNTGYDDKTILLKAAYNYLDSELTEDGYDGKIAPLVSKHNIKATAGYRFKNGLGFYYDIRYYSSFYKGNDYKNQAPKMRGYSVSDFKLEFVKKSYELFFKVNNIFDKEYYDYVYYSTWSDGYYPAPTRNFLAGATVKF
jgi:iron complex outermembrane receptor protein